MSNFDICGKGFPKKKNGIFQYLYIFWGITEFRNQSCVISEPIALIFSLKSWSKILSTFSRKTADQNPVTVP